MRYFENISRKEILKKNSMGCGFPRQWQLRLRLATGRREVESSSSSGAPAQLSVQRGRPSL
jgi:hypothetical protein